MRYPPRAGFGHERVIHVLHVTTLIHDIFVLVYKSIGHHCRLLCILHTRKHPEQKEPRKRRIFRGLLNSLRTWHTSVRYTISNKPRFRRATRPTTILSTWKHPQSVGRVCIQPGSPGLCGLKKRKPQLECHQKMCNTQCLLQKSKYVFIWRQSHDPVGAYRLLREHISEAVRRCVHAKVSLQTEGCTQRTTPANNTSEQHVRLDPFDTTTTFFCRNVLELVKGLDLGEHACTNFFLGGFISIDFIDGLTILNIILVQVLDRVAMHFVFALALFCTSNSRTSVQKLRSMDVWYKHVSSGQTAWG